MTVELAEEGRALQDGGEEVATLSEPGASIDGETLKSIKAVVRKGLSQLGRTPDGVGAAFLTLTLEEVSLPR